MSLQVLFSVWGIAVALALFAIGVIGRSLLAILNDICGTRDRARFWTLYALVLIILAPLLAVSAPGLLDAAARTGNTGLLLQRAVFYALVGIIVALMVVGRAVSAPVRNAPRKEQSPREQGDQ